VPIGKRAAYEPPAQRLPFEQFRDREVDAALAADVVEGHDVGMRKRGHHLGLALEPLERPLVLRALLRKHLQRHIPVQPPVPRAVDLAHSTRTDQGDDFIGTEAAARPERPATLRPGP
jgi:hypothetical protein